MSDNENKPVEQETPVTAEVKPEDVKVEEKAEEARLAAEKADKNKKVMD